MLLLTSVLWSLLEALLLAVLGAAVPVLAWLCWRQGRRRGGNGLAWGALGGAAGAALSSTVLLLPAALQVRAAERTYRAMGPSLLKVVGTARAPVSVELRVSDPAFAARLRPRDVLAAAPSVAFVETGSQDVGALSVARFARSLTAGVERDAVMRSTVVLSETSVVLPASWRYAVWSWTLDVRERDSGRPLGAFRLTCVDDTTWRGRVARGFPSPLEAVTSRLWPQARRLPGSLARCGGMHASPEPPRGAGLEDFLRRVLTPGR
ncbi:hypothetical protein [Deinococcus pimensis]|uniref:hypothetical protein n=1 Tax=Deinococcus pimensis TaxID=309888 RepID=UPI000486E0C9|nr:hypothetical protein [Deinococcus pimensis]